MDKKYEDQIAKMAFGELSEAEATEVRAHAAANADAAKMLSDYELLKGDLKRMRDVPPDQLSKERLQSAILGQGLKPKPVRRAFPWLWASSSAVMVAALAIVIFAKTAQTPSSSDGTVATDFTPQNSILGPGDNALINQQFNLEPISKRVTESPKEMPAVDTPASTPEVHVKPIAVPAVVQVMPKKFHSRESGRSLHLLHARGDLVRPIIEQPLALAPDNARDVNLATEKKEPQTLVLIKSDTDHTTGASSAVEVHQTQDVIVSS